MTSELVSSEKYIDSLERKLDRIKGKGKDGHEPTSKEMLHHLSAVKEAHMKELTDTSDRPFESNYSTNLERVNDAAAVTFLQRKLCPERQAIMVEELHPLVENDTLQTVTKTLHEAANTDAESQDVKSAS
ncbi:hypothetical protein NP493_737g02053 [Ridgeia piscesae]|uniref:Uncharacterized protein n=1 Tax=Ridgeia piscesae TaxID=27915 RepID=A0AAD9KR87_RIDPI|nr:hypothetical protein NP493_737g02053 [Ridgeia piscesae]